MGPMGTKSFACKDALNAMTLLISYSQQTALAIQAAHAHLGIMNQASYAWPVLVIV